MNLFDFIEVVEVDDCFLHHVDMNSMVADASCRSSASYLFINMLLCFCTYISNQWLNQQSNSARDPLSSKHCIISISQLLRHFDQFIINNYVKLIREGVVLGREPLIELETQSVHINIIMEQLNHQPDHCIRDHVVLSMNMTYQHHYHIHFYGHPIAPCQLVRKQVSFWLICFLKNCFLSASVGGSHHVKLSS